MILEESQTGQSEKLFHHKLMSHKMAKVKIFLQHNLMSYQITFLMFYEVFCCGKLCYPMVCYDIQAMKEHIFNAKNNYNNISKAN